MEMSSPFQFGVELELLLASRKKAYSNWKSLAKDLSKRLQKAGIPNHINEANDTSPDNYREWSIVQEVTIPSQPAKNLFGLELVSPIYPTNSPWSLDIQTIFTILHKSYTLTPSPHCSTHVHISPTTHPFSLQDLASLAKSILYYESALDTLFPPSRTQSYWCQSNRLNPALADYPLGDCLAAIDNATSVRGVVEMMNLFPASSAYGRAHGKKTDFVRGKVYKWDLTGVLLAGRGDVEFRQAPGSLGADEAVGWVMLGVGFVAGSVGGGWMGGEGGTREELWEVLCAGAGVLGWEVGGVEGLFG